MLALLLIDMLVYYYPATSYACDIKFFVEWWSRTHTHTHTYHLAVSWYLPTVINAVLSVESSMISLASCHINLLCKMKYLRCLSIDKLILLNDQRKHWFAFIQYTLFKVEVSLHIIHAWYLMRLKLKLYYENSCYSYIPWYQPSDLNKFKYYSLVSPVSAILYQLTRKS